MFLSLLKDVTGAQVEKNEQMGQLFKNLRMLLTDIDLYMDEHYGMTLSQHEKDMVLKMDVEEFIGFMKRKLKENTMQRIADTVRAAGAVRMSVYIDATDRICDLVNVDDEAQVEAFLLALAKEFGVEPDEEDKKNILQMSLSELANFILTLMPKE